jgi:histidinol dehydrogenase
MTVKIRMRTFNANTPEADAALRAILDRRSATNENALRVADEMIAGVRARGDAYVSEVIAKFDGVTIEPDSIRIAPRDVTISSEMQAAIDLAIDRVEAFHRPQLPQSYTLGNLEHRVRPIRRVGVYVPGGRAVYLSTLIMTAVPARIAGVEEIVCITTSSAADRDELHYVCNRLGVSEIYRSGGAAGIAAAAIGTQSLARVDKIVGPGNAYVTAAKMRLVGEVGIDMTAGPTELVVIADESADARFVIADLLAQAEHGSDSEVILLTTSQTLAAQMPDRALTFVVASLDEAVVIADRIAPEHLSIQTRDAASIGARVQNCGAIFCGPFAPPAAGDYVAGTNHVLPTAGSARFFSPLGVYDFVKRSNVIYISAEELAAISDAGERIATFEGLPAHAASMAIRRTA